MADEAQVGSAGAIGLTLGLSLLHAAMPNHWLPFVLVGRSLRWSRARTLSILALAGGGHVLATSILGVAVWFLGDAILARFDPEEIERAGGLVAGLLLCGLGAVYLFRHALGGHGHTHARGADIYADEHAEAHAHGHHHEPRELRPTLKDRGAVLTLFIALTFSPCEAVVAAFLSGVRFGFHWVLILAVSLSLATVAAMFVLTWLTLAGVERLRFPWLDRNEMAITGVVLVAIGALVLAWPH